MTEIKEKFCNICFKTDLQVKVAALSSFNSFFTDVLGFQNVPLQTMLCCWCEAAVRRASRLVRLAKTSQKRLLSKKIDTNPRENIYNLNIHHITPVSILPNIDYEMNEKNRHEQNILNESNKTDAKIKLELSENEENCLMTNDEFKKEIKKNEKADKLKKNSENEEIYLLNNDEFKTKINENKEANKLKRNSKNKKKLLMSNVSNDEFQTKINDNEEEDILKRNINCKELLFKIRYLSVEEQIEEIEMKKRSDNFKANKYKCEQCGVGFLTEDVFVEHTKRHEKTDYTCGICQLSFKSKEVLTQHSLGHRRRFSCLLCDRSLVRWKQCVVHRSRCGTEQSSEVCSYCRKIFSDINSLNIHIQGVHKTEKKHVCQVCDKRFSSKYKLTVHLRTHSGIKLFPCPRCTRSFATNSNMRAHLSLHTDERRHYCVECDFHFKTDKALKRHFKENSRHLEADKLVHKCMLCNKQFGTKKALNKHVNFTHLTK